MSTNCAEIQKRLELYLDQEVLSPAERDEVRNHIQECTSCAHALQQLESLRAKIGPAVMKTAQFGSDEVFLSELRRRLRPKVVELPRPQVKWWGKWAWRPAAALAAACLVVVVAVELKSGAPVTPPRGSFAQAPEFRAVGNDKLEAQTARSLTDKSFLEDAPVPKGGVAIDFVESGPDTTVLTYGGQDDEPAVIWVFNDKDNANKGGG